MADESSAVPIWCDVGKNLNAVSLVVSLGCFRKQKSSCTGKEKQIVRVYTRKLICNDHEAVDGNEETFRLKPTAVHYPADFSVIPKSCSGLSACRGSEIQMRLQYKYLTSDYQEELSTKHIKEELSKLRNGRHSVCCRMCGSAVLLPEKQFKRVLELPSENWLELAQDWCCHGSSHLTSAAGALEPGENDCFVREHYIKVHPAAVERDNLQIVPEEEDQLIKCSRCNTILGNIASEDTRLEPLEFNNVSSIHLYKHKLCLRNSNLFRSYCTETFISSCLISKLQGAINFRFLVQGPMQNGKKRTYACLWLFNADTAVVTNVHPTNLHSLTRTDTSAVYSVTNKGKYLRVLKILYKIKPLCGGSDWDDEVTTWQANPSVQLLTFTQGTCLRLVLLLAESTNTIAPSLRDMNGFKVGYLRTMNT